MKMDWKMIGMVQRVKYHRVVLDPTLSLRDHLMVFKLMLRILEWGYGRRKVFATVVNSVILYAAPV